MWKLFHFSSTVCNTLRSNIKQCCHTYKQFTRFTHTANTVKHQSLPKCTKQKPMYILPTVQHISVVLSGVVFVHIYLRNKTIHCEPAKTRLAGFKRSHDEDIKFDWNKLWSYLRPQIWYFVAAIFGALIVALLNVEIPRLMGEAINVVVKFSETKDSELFVKEIKTPALKLISMYLAQATSTFFYICMLSSIGEKIAYQMRRELFASIIQQDMLFFDLHRTGEIINRLTVDVQDFKSSFKQTVSGGLRAVTQIIGCSISLVLISPQMTLFIFLCVPSIIVVGTIFGAMLRRTSRNAQSQIEKTTAVADEAVANIRTVRAFAMEDQERDLFDGEAELAMVLYETLGFGIGLFQAGTNIFLNGMVLSTVYMGGYLLSTNQLSAGDMMAFLMASQTIQRSLAQISLLFGAIIRGGSAGARVFEYIKLQPTMSLTGGKIIPYDLLRGEIEFKDVSFAYPSRPEHIVLNKFNLKVPCGKTIAIVGASGNGKSTVVALLERFYDIDSGLITLDGEDISKLDPLWLRQKALGLISQEPVLFGTTVMENIRYGKPNATDEEVRNAARLANADEFITKFPRGYDTFVGERGATLSGGQKQRIAIARALLKNPCVLLLDEATSALDAESEKIVQSALEQARHGRTVMIIAHRLSTIQNADVIVVLHKGNIIEMGTHESLQKLRGYYWALIFQQQHSPGG